MNKRGFLKACIVGAAAVPLAGIALSADALSVPMRSGVGGVAGKTILVGDLVAWDGSKIAPLNGFTDRILGVAMNSARQGEMVEVVTSIDEAINISKPERGDVILVTPTQPCPLVGYIRPSITVGA